MCVCVDVVSDVALNYRLISLSARLEILPTRDRRNREDKATNLFNKFLEIHGNPF